MCGGVGGRGGRWGDRTVGLFVKSSPCFQGKKQHRNIFSHDTGRLAEFGWILAYLIISLEMAVTWLLPDSSRSWFAAWRGAAKHALTAEGESRVGSVRLELCGTPIDCGRGKDAGAPVGLRG